jgi:hypothetical protein
MQRKLMITFIRNKTCEMMVPIQFSGSPKVQAETLTDLELDENLMNALRRSKQMIQWKFPETNIYLDIDTSLNKIVIKSSTLMLAEVVKGIIFGTFKNEFGLQLNEHCDCKKYIMNTLR